MPINVHIMSKIWDIIFSILQIPSVTKEGVHPGVYMVYTCTYCAYYVLVYRMYMSKLYVHMCAWCVHMYTCTRAYIVHLYNMGTCVRTGYMVYM